VANADYSANAKLVARQCESVDKEFVPIEVRSLIVEKLKNPIDTLALLPEKGKSKGCDCSDPPIYS
jgi:hypothetical protein